MENEYFNLLDTRFQNSLISLELSQCIELQKWLKQRINYLENIPHVKKEVKDLNLSTRAYNALLQNNLNTVEEILRFGWNNIAYIKNIGIKTAKEIRAVVEVKLL